AHDRRHRHHARDADHHTEDRQRGTHLGDAEGAQGEGDVFTEGEQAAEIGNRKSEMGTGRVRSPIFPARFAGTRRFPISIVDIAHSALNATTGSSCDARCAGYTPNNTPTLAPSPSASSTDHSVTRAGSGDTA